MLRPRRRPLLSAIAAAMAVTTAGSPAMGGSRPAGTAAHRPAAGVKAPFQQPAESTLHLPQALRSAALRPLPSPEPTAAPGVPIIVRNLRYKVVPGVEARLTSLDIYTVDGARHRPVMIYVHGGGWAAGDKRNVALKPRAFLARGYVFISTNYRLTPDAVFPAHVEDVASAIVAVRDGVAQYGGDPDRISLMGHSAGAHLVALVATDGALLEAAGASLDVLTAVVPLDTQAYDIPRLAQTAGGSLPSVYEAVFGTDPAMWARASPITHVAAGRGIPPMIVAYSGGGGPRPNPNRARQADGFAARLQGAGVTAEVVPAPEKSHAAINREFGAPGDRVTEAVFEFLERPVPGPPVSETTIEQHEERF